MKLSNAWLWFGLHSCLYCGSLTRKSDGLCPSCSENLWSWQEPQKHLYRHPLEKTMVEALFLWVPGRQEVLSRLILALKGPRRRQEWAVYAQEFWRCQLRNYAENRVPPLIFVAAPCKHGTAVDHAALFASELARQSGGELVSCLLRETSELAQKQKNRQQRSKTTLVLSKNFTKEDLRRKFAGKRIVFVDDVVTSGATAKAAWRALGKPRDFAVWALAYRGLSCGVSKDLV